MKRYHLSIPWWLPFAYFSPSMMLFFIYPFTPSPWLSATDDWWFVFGFATLNFLFGIYRMSVSFVTLSPPVLIIQQGWRSKRFDLEGIQAMTVKEEQVTLRYVYQGCEQTISFKTPHAKILQQHLQEHL